MFSTKVQSLAIKKRTLATFKTACTNGLDGPQRARSRGGRHGACAPDVVPHTLGQDSRRRHDARFAGDLGHARVTSHSGAWSLRPDSRPNPTLPMQRVLRAHSASESMIFAEVAKGSVAQAHHLAASLVQRANDQPARPYAHIGPARCGEAHCRVQVFKLAEPGGRSARKNHAPGQIDVHTHLFLLLCEEVRTSNAVSRCRRL